MKLMILNSRGLQTRLDFGIELKLVCDGPTAHSIGTRFTATAQRTLRNTKNSLVMTIESKFFAITSQQSSLILQSVAFVVPSR